MRLKTFYRQTAPYHMLIISLFAIISGSFTGHVLGSKALVLKPLSDIFLNLMFTMVIPLIFFSLTSAITQITQPAKLWRILSTMCLVFLVTSFIAAVFMLLIVLFYPLENLAHIHFAMPVGSQVASVSTELVNIFTVSDFSQLLNHDHILALIIFSGLIGLATVYSGEKGKPFASFLQSGMHISMKAISFIMYYAPIGFFAYFAIIIAQLGSDILTTYAKITVLYYVAAFVYFVVILSLYAFIADKKSGLKRFWQHIFFPAATSLATCSSAASIPANLHAADKMGVPPVIYELVIPFGGIAHKDGSVLGGIIKIAFLFSLFHLPFTGLSTWGSAIFISMLVGTVMGAIPSGGMIGEMLILSVYGFPPQALVMIAAISILIDPPATLLNVTSNTACSLLIARWNKRIV